MTPHLQWFCYEAVRLGVVDGPTCRQIARVLGPDADLLSFAQALIDHDLVDDAQVVQDLVNLAYRKGESGEVPPLDILAMDTKPVDDDDDDDVGSVTVHQVMVRRQAAPTADMPDFDQLDLRDLAEAAEAITRMLRAARAAGASDLHLSAGARPFLRQNMRVVYLSDSPLDPEHAVLLNTALLDDEQRATFTRKQDFDFACALGPDERYRINLLMHKEGAAGTYRIIPDHVRPLEELGFSNAKIIRKLLAHHNGLILVTGPLGCGKTTTLAALVDFINVERSQHIITVEDPLEIIQYSKKCNVTQREVGGHTDSFASALKAALREDPDIIIIGELRDLETIEMAITAAETGHLVIGTLHTRDAATTLGRLLDVFPPEQQQQIRSMTAESLRGVICQRMLPAIDGTVVLAEELLINTIAVANVIRENKMHQLRSIMQTGVAQGMCTMDDAIFRLFKEGRISEATAQANIQDTAISGKLGAAKAAASPVAEDADESESSKRKRGWFR